MHNAWKCNSIYVRKLSEAGLPPQLKLGDLALPSDDKYILEVDNALDRLAKGITKQVLAKHWPETAKVYESAFDD